MREVGQFPAKISNDDFLVDLVGLDFGNVILNSISIIYLAISISKYDWYLRFGFELGKIEPSSKILDAYKHFQLAVSCLGPKFCFWNRQCGWEWTSRVSRWPFFTPTDTTLKFMTVIMPCSKFIQDLKIPSWIDNNPKK